MVQRIQLADKKIQEIPPNQTVLIEDDYSITILRDNDKFTLGSDHWLCAYINGKLTVNKKQWNVNYET